MDAEGVQRPSCADAQQHLLGEPRRPRGDVQLVGDPPILGLVAVDIRVEQEERHPANLRDPDHQADLTTRQLDSDLERAPIRPSGASEGKVARVDVGLEVLLPPLGVDSLAEVATVVERPDADHRQARIGRGLQQVAGQHPQPTRVHRQRFVKGEFGTEIGDRPAEVPAQSIGAVLEIVVEPADDGRRVRHESFVRREGRPSVGIGLAQKPNRVAGARPALRVDPGKQALGLRMPRPPQVFRQLAQAVQARRIG
jgi:hypothetical protein